LSTGCVSCTYIVKKQEQAKKERRGIVERLRKGTGGTSSAESKSWSVEKGGDSAGGTREKIMSLTLGDRGRGGTGTHTAPTPPPPPAL